MFISEILLLIFFKNWMSLISGLMVFCYVAMRFLSWKLDDIIHDIRVSVFRNNKNKIIEIIDEYNEYAKIIKDVTPEMNMVVGNCYLLVPFLIPIAFEGIRQQHEIFFRVIAIILTIVGFSALLLFNSFCSSIPERNHSISKYLYPIFCRKSTHIVTNEGTNRILIRIRLIKEKLKIMKFLEGLDEDYMGFRCYNLFEFTRLAFYQNINYIFSVYCLIIGLVSGI